MMNEVVFAVVLRQGGDYRYVLHGRTHAVLCYPSMEDALAAARRYAKRHRAIMRRSLITLRVIPLSPEASLANIWFDYKHTEVS